MSDDTQDIDRRSVLKSVGSASVLTALSTSVAADPSTAGKELSVPATESSVPVRAILESETVESLTTEIPGLELRPDDAVVMGADESLLNVPANHGRLVTTVPPSSDGDQPQRGGRRRRARKPSGQSGGNTADIRASFYFEEWVPGVDEQWKAGTAGRLVATDEGALLQRTATEEEKSQYLAAVGRTEFVEADTEVTVTPEYDTVEITHQNRSQRRFESLQAVGTGQAADGVGALGVADLEVVDETVQEVPEVSNETVSAEDCCNKEILLDTLWCIIDTTDCHICRWAWGAGPWTFGACLFFVCLKGGAEILEEKVTDFGCSKAAGCVTDCLVQEFEKRRSEEETDCGGNILEDIACASGPIVVVP